MSQATHAPAMQHLFHALGRASFSVPRRHMVRCNNHAAGAAYEYADAKSENHVACQPGDDRRAPRLRHCLTDVLFRSPNRHA
jgi:hypothetical protein